MSGASSFYEMIGLLGQVETNGSWQLLYSVPELKCAAISTIVIGNFQGVGGAADTLDICIMQGTGGSGTPSLDSYIYKALTVNAQTFLDYLNGITLNALDDIYVRVITGNRLAVSVFGAESNQSDRYERKILVKGGIGNGVIDNDYYFPLDGYQTWISGILVCNTDTVNRLFDIAVVPDFHTGTQNANYLRKSVSIKPNQTYFVNPGICLINDGDARFQAIRVNADAPDVVIATLFGETGPAST